jgi:serine/threonine protein kinase
MHAVACILAMVRRAVVRSRAFPTVMQERTEVAQEVKLLAHLSHVNVVKFYDNFVDHGVMHILMEFATGGTLYKQIVNREVRARLCSLSVFHKIGFSCLHDTTASTVLVRVAGGPV